MPEPQSSALCVLSQYHPARQSGDYRVSMHFTMAAFDPGSKSQSPAQLAKLTFVANNWVHSGIKD